MMRSRPACQSCWGLRQTDSGLLLSVRSGGKRQLGMARTGSRPANTSPILTSGTRTCGGDWPRPPARPDSETSEFHFHYRLSPVISRCHRLFRDTAEPGESGVDTGPLGLHFGSPALTFPCLGKRDPVWRPRVSSWSYGALGRSVYECGSASRCRGSRLTSDGAACLAWPRWCAADPELAVVDELAELSEWTRQAAAQRRNDVLARLAALTKYDSVAAPALTWLLVPGATRLANDLRDLDPGIDGLVAGQLWVEVSGAYSLNGGRIAGAILGRARREVCAELGVGDGARRRDRVWAESIRVGSARELDVAADGYESQDELFDQVTELMIDAMDANAIHVFDAWLLGHLASVAAQMGVAGSRGRMGLTTPAVVDEVAGMVHLSPRAIRRRATTALDRFAEYRERAGESRALRGVEGATHHLSGDPGRGDAARPHRGLRPALLQSSRPAAGRVGTRRAPGASTPCHWVISRWTR